MPTDFSSTSGGDGIVKADEFQTGAGVSAPKVTLSTTLTINPPSLTTGAFAESDFALPGVQLGDAIELYPPYDTQGIMYQASVQAADNITVKFSSCNTGTVDLASGSWGVVAKRRV
jgi:hypothetical protein